MYYFFTSFNFFSLNSERNLVYLSHSAACLNDIARIFLVYAGKVCALRRKDHRVSATRVTCDEKSFFSREKCETWNDDKLLGEIPMILMRIRCSLLVSFYGRDYKIIIYRKFDMFWIVSHRGVGFKKTYSYKRENPRSDRICCSYGTYVFGIHRNIAREISFETETGAYELKNGMMKYSWTERKR